MDANILNFIRLPGLWASVDWENSGWGDPAFEIADLLAHPVFLGISPKWQDWVIESYGQLAGDTGAAIRIRTYYRILQVFWVVRCARYLNVV